jgi:hypothetical protein
MFYIIILQERGSGGSVFNPREEIKKRKGKKVEKREEEKKPSYSIGAEKNPPQTPRPPGSALTAENSARAQDETHKKRSCNVVIARVAAHLILTI